MEMIFFHLAFGLELHLLQFLKILNEYTVMKTLI